MLEVLCVLAGVLVLLATLYVSLEAEDTFNPAYTLVKTWNKLKEKLNLAGCIICIIPVGIISLPGVILSSVINIVHWFWKGFMYVFRKRK